MHIYIIVGGVVHRQFSIGKPRPERELYTNRNDRLSQTNVSIVKA